MIKALVGISRFQRRHIRGFLGIAIAMPGDTVDCIAYAIHRHQLFDALYAALIGIMVMDPNFSIDSCLLERFGKMVSYEHAFLFGGIRATRILSAGIAHGFVLRRDGRYFYAALAVLLDIFDKIICQGLHRIILKLTGNHQI